MEDQELEIERTEEADVEAHRHDVGEQEQEEPDVEAYRFDAIVSDD